MLVTNTCTRLWKVSTYFWTKFYHPQATFIIPETIKILYLYEQKLYEYNGIFLILCACFEISERFCRQNISGKVNLSKGTDTSTGAVWVFSGYLQCRLWDSVDSRSTKLEFVFLWFWRVWGSIRLHHFYCPLALILW